jgi:hypothetical protein
MKRGRLYWWLWNWRYRVMHPREWLCDAGVWKCSTHPRLLHLPEDRRWAWRHKLRARRVARFTGWTRAELDTMLTPLRQSRSALYATLAADMRQVLANHQGNEIRIPGVRWSLHSHTEDGPCNDECSHYPPYDQVITTLPPWQAHLAELIARDLSAGRTLIVNMPRQHGGHR